VLIPLTLTDKADKINVAFHTPFRELFSVDIFSLAGLSAGLAMDAAAVSAACGTRSRRFFSPSGWILSLSFGLFQGIMPLIGWMIGKAGETLICLLDHWLALILLLYLGIHMILESRDKPAEKTALSWKRVLLLSLATSTDALAVGIIFPSAVGAASLKQMVPAASVIAAVTFCFSIAAFGLGIRFGKILSARAEIAGGCILIAIGVKIFLEHTLP
jgi:putative Mn2+ efflux pump MntP